MTGTDAETVLTERILAEAVSWCGTPYRHQASVKGVGADCLGLLRGVYRALYGDEPQAPPPYARRAVAGEGETLWRAAQTHLRPPAAGHGFAAGQVLLFRMRPRRPARHVAIAVSDGAMVHAVSGAHVCVVPLTLNWRRLCVARFRFPLPSELSVPVAETAAT